MPITITRRTLLRDAMLGVAAHVLPIRTHARTSRRVVISGWGGATQRAMRQAFFDPFTRETGIAVEEHSYGNSGLARLKTQLKSGAPQLDLLDGAPFWALIGRRQGLLERIVLPDVPRADFIPRAIEDYSFGYSVVSWGITYLRGKQRPEHWQDFWDVQRLPGRRAMFGPLAARHLEYALMADGVPAQQVNPLTPQKVERAFDKLQELKPHIDVWYQTPAQCERLLLDRQVQMTEFFNGRAFFLKDQGVPLEFQWNQAISNMTVMVLARDAPNREHALQLLRFMAQPQPQAHFARLICYGPTNTRALDLIDSQRTLERMPTHPRNLSRQLMLDCDWWGQHYESMGARWSQFLAST